MKEKLIVVQTQSETRVGTKKFGWITISGFAPTEKIEDEYEKYLQENGVVASVLDGYVMKY